MKMRALRLLPLILICAGGLAQRATSEDAKSPVTSSVVSATAEGREIRASSAAGGVTINTSGATATVNMGKQVLKIEKARLQLGDQMPSDIPPETRLVEIQVAEEMLIVRADGKEVLRAKIE